MTAREPTLEPEGPTEAMALEPATDYELRGRAEHELERIRRAVLEAAYPDTGGNLLAHAQRELHLAHLRDPDADYGGMVAHGVEDLVRVFASQGHSGGSAQLTVGLFRRLASFDVLTPLTAHPDEWAEVQPGLWQNRRKPSAFWRRGEATWYVLSENTEEVR